MNAKGRKQNSDLGDLKILRSYFADTANSRSIKKLISTSSLRKEVIDVLKRSPTLRVNKRTRTRSGSTNGYGNCDGPIEPNRSVVRASLSRDAVNDSSGWVVR
jgi:hypothetical protein